MNNFRQPQKKHKKSNTLDGFLPRDASFEDKGDIHKKFRQSYKPNKSQPLNNSNNFDIEEASFEEEGFLKNSLRVEKAKPQQQTNEFDLSLDEKPKKRRFFRRNKKDNKRTVRQRVVRSFGVSFLALLIAVGSIFAYGYIKTRQIFKGNGDGAAALQQDVDPSRLNGEGDGRVNILLLGKGGPGHTAPDLTDTILLASIDPIQNEVALVSIPRDLYVKDPNGYSTKINAIYSNAKQSELSKNSEDTETAEEVGLRTVKQTVSDVMGVPVHYYGMVNFNAFEQSINTVGGITIDVKEPLVDWSMAWLNNGDPTLAEQGLQSFDGKRALYYARSRLGSSRGDFDRTERQREVLVALQKKILSVGTFSNPIKVVELLNAFGDNVRTDLNGTGELKRLYEIAQNISEDKVISVGLADPPNMLVTTDFIDNQSVVVPVEGLYQYDEIQSYIRNTLRDAFLKQEDARIIILNGTATPGLATAREKELKSYGYNIISVDNAPTDNYTTSKIIDLSKGEKRYTKSYLEKRLGITTSEEYIEGLPTNETADFVIILGNDEALKKTSN